MANLQEILLTTQEEKTMDPINYQFFNQLSQRSIILNSEVEDDIIEKVVLPLLEFEKDDSNDPVTLYLNTPGGSVFAAMFLCNVIDNYKKPLNIIGLGYFMSMGTLIMMAGKNNPNVTKICYDFSIALLHAGSIVLEGDAKTVKQTMDFNEGYQQKVKKYILSHTNFTEEEYEKVKDLEYYMYADELKRLGIVDTIIS